MPVAARLSLMPTDENGEPVRLDGTRPPDVLTAQHAARCDLCVQIAVSNSGGQLRAGCHGHGHSTLRPR
jgi:hypothetical protein